jgi:hypothetical protein
MATERGEMERREFVRIRAALPVRYVFLDSKGDRLPPGISEGASGNLSAGGLLLQGKIPDLSWVPELLAQRMAMVVSISLPAELHPIETVARVAWIETIEPASRRCNLGLMFREITREDQDRLFRFVVRSQLS